MDYNTIKDFLDANMNPKMMNSAATVSRYSARNEELALKISEEQNRQEKQFMSKFEKQIDLLEGSLKQSEENYKKLNDLYELKCKEFEKSKKELEESEKYNKKMMLIAIVSAGFAMVSIVLTILFKFI